MSMTKTDYELVGEVFKTHRQLYGGRTDSVVIELINDMAASLENDIDGFDRKRFLKSCGVESW